MALSNVRRHSVSGSLWQTIADFAHTVGAADETLAVEGDVYEVNINHDSGSEAVGVPCQFTQSKSGTLNTVTFHYAAAVADGQITILHGYQS